MKITIDLRRDTEKIIHVMQKISEKCGETDMEEKTLC